MTEPATGDSSAKGSRALRVPGSQLQTGGDVKVSPGGPAELVNLSETGALVETTARLVVGSTVALCIGGSRPQRLPGRVVRCQVCGIHRDNTMTYQVAIAFESAKVEMSELQTPAPDAAAAAASEAAVAEPEMELVNEW